MQDNSKLQIIKKITSIYGVEFNYGDLPVTMWHWSYSSLFLTSSKRYGSGLEGGRVWGGELGDSEASRPMSISPTPNITLQLDIIADSAKSCTRLCIVHSPR